MSDEVKEMMVSAMSRKQFLQLAGAGLVSAFGITNFINHMIKHHKQSRQVTVAPQAPMARGFGARTFGN